MFIAKRIFYVAFLLLFIGCTDQNENSVDQKVIENNNATIDGEKLYKTLCANCHKCDKDFAGPMLSGSFSRWKNRKLLYEFMRNPALVIEKDKYARELKNKYGFIMLGYRLSDSEVDSIINYCSNTSPVPDKKK
jgi:hypothetical protein